MADPASFTERELDIMSVLWEHGSGTVAEVRDALPMPLGYTSVLKMLQILAEKRLVRHEQEGRAYRYYPLVEQGAAGGHALGRIVDKIFQGSAELALARLVKERPLSTEEVGRLKTLLDRAAADADSDADSDTGGDA